MGWKLGEPDILVAKLADGGTIASAKTTHGAHVKYSGYFHRNKSEPVLFYLNQTPGSTNCREGLIGGRTNIRNNQLTIQKHPSSFSAILTDSMGYVKKYATPRIHDIILHFGLLEEKNTQGMIKSFEYGNDSLKITTGNRAKNLQYATLFYQGDSRTIKVHSSSNDTVLFTFKKFKYRKNGTKTEADFLSDVNSSQKLSCHYDYERSSIDHPMISSVSIQNRKQLEIDYYQSGKNSVGDRTIDKKESSKCIDKVKQLKKRSSNGDLIPSHRFFYHLDDLSKKGWTEVYDASNNRTDYFYNVDQRLEYIIKYNHGQPFTRETFTWGPNGSVDEGNLAGKYLQEEEGPYRSAKVFYYDKNGNVTALRDYSFVNGHNGPELSIDKDGKPHAHNQTEYYLRTYTYDPKSNLMLSEHEANGKNIYYKYIPETDLVSSKILVYGKDKVLLREFYDYDDNCFLYRKVVDDGTSLDRHNHDGVTCMKVTYIKPRMSPPFGVPEQLDEMYRDCLGAEHLLHRTINHHLPNGKLARQDHYDNQGSKLYTLEWEYNAHGLVTKEVDALGRTTEKKYDEYDRLVYQYGPSTEYHTTFIYNEADELVEKIEHHSDGRFSLCYRYDILGNLIAKRDIHGNETTYSYDGLNRCIKIAHPDNTHEEMGYDIFGNVTYKKDRNGYETHTLFNSLGKPLKIQHPDGTQESFEYWQEGTLKKATAKDGTYTSYYRDCMGRVLEETRYDANHQPLTKRTFHRNSFNMIDEIDPEGNIIHYEYDAAARLIKKTDKHQTVTFEYDSCNRIHKEIHWISPQEAQVTVFIYDFANRIIEERIENLTGHCYSLTRTTYDVHDKKTSITFGDQTDRTIFNSHQDPILLIDSEGNETRFEYHYNYTNEKGQDVTAVTVIDPMGNKIFRVHDLNDHIANESQYNAFGKLLSYSERTYDPFGKLLYEKNKRIIDGTTKETISTSWTYNTNGELLSLIEAVGTKEQRQRSYRYNSLAQKTELIKPDGTILYYSYDSKGRLARLWSSDRTVDYSYSYNRNDQIVLVKDNFLNSTTRRDYDGERLLSETLGNGLTLTFDYDNLNRRTTTTLPDKSTIEYRFDAVHLREICRANYSHINKSYDIHGNVTECSLPLSAGTLKFEYDHANRKRKMIHPAYTETIPQNGYDKAGNLLSYCIKDVGTYSFAYDDLYQLVTEDGVEKHHYSYDSLNNRLRKDDEIATVNSLNQIKKFGNSRLVYDLNGNLIKMDNVTFAYDALNRLIEVQTPDNRYRYTYDFENRRLTKNDEDYLYENQLHIGVYCNHKPIALRILGETKSAEIGAAIAIELNHEVFVPLHDHNGNVVTLLNGHGVSTRNYTYTAFGEHVNLDPNDLNPWRFSSKVFDAETGFTYFGRRYYAPSLGRWITPDPTDYDDGPNLYCYVRNRPLSMVDIFGLECTDLFTFIRPGYEGLGSDTVTFYDTFEDGREQSRVFDLELPEFCDSRVIYMNGINTNLLKHKETAQTLCKMYGYNIHSIYNATHGIPTDLWESCLGTFHIATPPVRLLHQKWNEMLKNNNGAKILQICHSQGAIHVANALLSYDPELRKRIIVLAIAPGGYIDSKTCAQVIHYRAEAHKDFVPQLDRKGLAREEARGTVKVVKSTSECAWDHGIDSSSYRQILQTHLDVYKYSGGKNI